MGTVDLASATGWCYLNLDTAALWIAIMSVEE